MQKDIGLLGKRRRTMIIRHDRSDRDSLVDEGQWPALTSFFRGHGGASLIAPRWLLTAAHVAQNIPSEIRLSVELALPRIKEIASEWSVTIFAGWNNSATW